MRAGELRHRVEIWKYSVTADDSGELIETWTKDCTCWAAINPLEGTERYQAQRLDSTVTTEIKMRYIEGLTPQDRIKRCSDGRKFEVTSIINTDERNIELRMMCKESV